MKLAVRIFYTTADLGKSVDQMDKRFCADLEAPAGKEPAGQPRQVNIQGQIFDGVRAAIR